MANTKLQNIFNSEPPQLCAVVRDSYEFSGPPEGARGFLHRDLSHLGPRSFNPAASALNIVEAIHQFDIYAHYEKLRATESIRLAYGSKEGEALMEMDSEEFSLLFPELMAVFLFRSGVIYPDGVRKFPYIYLDERGVIRRHWFDHRYYYGAHAAPQFTLEQYEQWL